MLASALACRPYSKLVLAIVREGVMETARKITVEAPPELLKNAQRACGTGLIAALRDRQVLVAADLRVLPLCLLESRPADKFQKTYHALQTGQNFA